MDQVDNYIAGLIRKDTDILSPEFDEYTKSLHTAIKHCEYPVDHFASEKGGMITRYYEDDRFARAYGLIAYKGGIAIICDKQYNEYYTTILGEDDGAWFPRESWAFDKSDYIACIAEALSIFNSNFNE